MYLYCLGFVKVVIFSVASLLILIYVCECCVEVRTGKKGLLYHSLLRGDCELGM